ncbi:MAG: hypothetical protein JWM34_2490 [Ilumatobacteraceae bacterium]|nr:hypothetical protein [Ilumatobacteraceae bacterium]
MGELSIEVCEVCGFEWDAVTAGEVPARLRATASGFGEALRSGDPTLAIRPEPAVWSAVEYGCHARDVMFNLRDRIINGIAEDNPVPKPQFTDVRIAVGLYANDQPEQLARDIDVAADLLARTIEAMTPELLARPIFYPWPRPATRNLLWVAAQALHEAEHHLDDVRRSLTAR